MLSLNQIKQLFNDQQQNLALLSSGDFLFDPMSEQISTGGGINYPLTGIVTIDADLDGVVLTTSFDCVFADLVHQDRGNKDDVMSNMLQCALDFYSKVKYILETGYNQTIKITSTLEPLEDFNDDSAFGWKLSLDVIQNYDRSTCLTPDSGNHAGQVTIYNPDGSVAAYINPNGSYTLIAMATNTAETHVLVGLTQVLNHQPAFIYGIYAPNIRLVEGTNYTVVGAAVTYTDPNLTGLNLIYVYSY